MEIDLNIPKFYQKIINNSHHYFVSAIWQKQRFQTRIDFAN